MGSSRVFYVMVLVVLVVLVGGSAGSTLVSTFVIFMIYKRKPLFSVLIVYKWDLSMQSP
jgi:hypothetical protein